MVGKLLEGNESATFGYNAATDNYEDLVAAGIIDPLKVELNSHMAITSMLHDQVTHIMSTGHSSICSRSNLHLSCCSIGLPLLAACQNATAAQSSPSRN